MRTLPPALAAYLAGYRGKNFPGLVADAYLFTLQPTPQLGGTSGLSLAYTSADVPITLENGVKYLSSSVLVSGLKYKCAIGVDADEQTLNIAARPTDLVGDMPFLQALRQRVLDRAEFESRLAFYSDRIGGTLLGSVIVFSGRVTSVSKLGRVTAQVTVKSELVLLDIDMPRNTYGPTCQHALYDSGCGVNRASYSATGTVGSGSTGSVINWTASDPKYNQGSIVLGDGRYATIKYATAGQSLTLVRAFDEPPAAGAAFTVYQGCDHTQGTCQSKFNNLLNFRGFPFVPPQQASL